MSTTFGKVRKTKEGGWIADVSIGGRRKIGRAATKKEADARRRELVAELLAGAPQVAVIPPEASFRMSDALRLSAAIRWAGTPGERTALINAKAAVQHFGPHTEVSSITARAVDGWRQELLRAGNRPATVNHKCSALRGLLSDAALHGHIQAVPTLPKQLREGNHRDVTISDEQRDALCKWFVQAGHPAAADLLVFALESAARWGEIERLRGQDVRLADGKGTATFWITKSGKSRSIPLTRRAIDAITPHLPAVRTHRVWPYSYLQMRRLVEAAKDGCGLSDSGITIHVCRHTAASKMASKGVALAQIMKYGGWSSLQAVQRYLHLTTESMNACIEALED
jgi:integrase